MRVNWLKYIWLLLLIFCPFLPSDIPSNEPAKPIRHTQGHVIYATDGHPVVYSFPNDGPVVVVKPRKSWHPMTGPMEPK